MYPEEKMNSFTEYSSNELFPAKKSWVDYVSLHLFSDLSGSNLANESQSQAFIHFCQVDFVYVSFLIIKFDSYLFIFMVGLLLYLCAIPTDNCENKDVFFF